jgi:metal-responsive CopG/Arc/MetJ family transcriptional regulator
MAQDRVTLKIPRPLYEKLKVVIEGSSYRSVNEFVVYVLRDLMAEQPQSASEDITGLTEKEIAIIRDRLHKLGYL